MIELQGFGSNHQGKCCINHWQLTSPRTTHAYVPALPSRCDFDTAPPSPPSPLLMLPNPTSSSPHTILTLLQHPQDMPPMPPSTRLILSAAYHANAHVLDS
ncbi:hypothetical protein O181_010331 [Austropuccinia psidii MF-1]|uniref:Uncharacterized protein n=1 Tax=Austropuccinia psidii MF-1 TaxID=1389203 RepID=A0A9Q3BTK1_9BASI|nr:hypothetical protein [Austropuccinia psidii MF-1]